MNEPVTPAHHCVPTQNVLIQNVFTTDNCAYGSFFFPHHRHHRLTFSLSLLSEALTSASLFDCLYVEMSASLDHRTAELLEYAVRLARGLSPVPPGACGHDMAGGRESITHRAKRFLTSLVPRYPRDREREGGKFFRQKSRSCHDLGAL